MINKCPKHCYENEINKIVKAYGYCCSDNNCEKEYEEISTAEIVHLFKQSIAKLKDDDLIAVMKIVGMEFDDRKHALYSRFSNVKKSKMLNIIKQRINKQKED